MTKTRGDPLGPETQREQREQHDTNTHTHTHTHTHTDFFIISSNGTNKNLSGRHVFGKSARNVREENIFGHRTARSPIGSADESRPVAAELGSWSFKVVIPRSPP